MASQAIGEQSQRICNARLCSESALESSCFCIAHTAERKAAANKKAKVEAWRRANGRCHACGDVLPPGEDPINPRPKYKGRLCDSCTEKRADLHAFRQKYRSDSQGNRRCTQCRSTLLDKYKTCLACREKAKERRRARVTQRHCHGCGKPKEVGAALCDSCLDSHKQYSAHYVQYVRLNREKKLKDGLCACGRELPPLEGYKRCLTCLGSEDGSHDEGGEKLASLLVECSAQAYRELCPAPGSTENELLRENEETSQKLEARNLSEAEQRISIASLLN